MGETAMLSLLGDAVSEAQTFVNVFFTVYWLVLFLYIITSWLRLPYSPVLNRIQRFLYDVSEPYLRLFRRLIPSAGPIDFSPIVGFIFLIVLDRLLTWILGKFH